MSKKKQIFAVNRIKPLKNCNFGFLVRTKFFLKKNNIIGKTKNTVKKYLAHVICNTGKSVLKNLAKPSIMGKTIHAAKLRITALIKKTIY